LNLVEKHIIKGTIELDEITFKCKNLYNKVLYIIRQDYINEKIIPNKYSLFNDCKTLPEYKELPARVSRGVIRILVTNWKSYFQATKEWYKYPQKFNKKPKLPKYLDKKGKFTSIFTDSAILKKNINKGLIGLSSLKIQIPLQHKDNKIVEVQLVPYINNKYKVNIVYKHENIKTKENNKRYASIDIGLNNLMTITSNTGSNPLIVNGKPLKSLNQFYNKRKSFYTSELELKQKTKRSKRLEKLSYKRTNKMNDYLHKSSRFLINYCIEQDINTIIMGYNVSWKQSIKLGKRNNQNFVSVPFYKLISFIKYKCKLYGINLILNEESYTSICSFLDLEKIKKHVNYKGKRIKRGLFESSDGRKINADVNASYNIMRKVVPNVFTDGIEGISVHPIKINF